VGDQRTSRPRVHKTTFTQTLPLIPTPSPSPSPHPHPHLDRSTCQNHSFKRTSQAHGVLHPLVKLPPSPLRCGPISISRPYSSRHWSAPIRPAPASQPPPPPKSNRTGEVWSVSRRPERLRWTRARHLRGVLPRNPRQHHLS
jgi:hypothetical protein